MNIGIRADGNNKIGMGHIIRSLALALQFKKHGHRVLYWIQENDTVSTLLHDHGIEVVVMKSGLTATEELMRINQDIVQHDIGIFIGDAYHIDSIFMHSLERDKTFIVLIDVLRDMSLDADLIINGGIYAIDYKDEAERYGRAVLLGPRYNLLREQFSNLGTRQINSVVRNVLIIMGGADVLGLTPLIMRSLNEFDRGLMIDVVMGASFSNIAEIKDVAREIPNVTLHHDVMDMVELMWKCDLAISAAGTTLYELAATGTPTLAIIQAENQVKQTERFEEMGIIINLGRGANLRKELLFNTLDYIINNKGKRQRMSELGQSIVDGKGAERCYGEIIERVRKRIDARQNDIE